jgi:hypothetical protein
MVSVGTVSVGPVATGFDFLPPRPIVCVIGVRRIKYFAIASPRSTKRKGRPRYEKAHAGNAAPAWAYRILGTATADWPVNSFGLPD